MSKSLVHLFTCVFLFVAMSGCASPNGIAVGANSAAGRAHAECLVCKYNADLACIDVAIDENTPTRVVDGKTYYFCSDACRQSFAKDPGKYLAK